MRLIDADALVAQWEVEAEQVEDVIAKMFIHAAIHDVKHAPTIETEQQWIPCSERLPEEFELVITCSEFGEIEFGSYEKGKWYWLAESHSYFFVENNDEVVAWMEMPEPWKGEEGETANK